MIDRQITLVTGGGVQLSGHTMGLTLGYTRNRGIYRLAVSQSGEWQGLTVRACWHLPDGSASASTLIENGYVEIPASVTAQPGDGCITFEGSDGTRTVTSADLRYHVGANSGTEDGTLPEPGTPAWEGLISVVKDNADISKRYAENAADAANRAENDRQATQAAKADALNAIGTGQKQALEAVEKAQTNAAQEIAGETQAALDSIADGRQNALDDVKRAQDGAVQAVSGEKQTVLEAVAKAKDNAVAEVDEQVDKAEESRKAASQCAADAKASADAAAKSAAQASAPVQTDTTLAISGAPADAKAVGDALAGKSSTGHTHDDRYYTEAEVDGKLAGKSNTNHTHNYAGSGSAGGAANSACRLEGFATQTTSQAWGNQTGTFIHGENDSTGGSLAFRRDNPIAGELSLIIDGRFYQDEGKYMCLDTNNYSAYAATKNHTHSAATQSAAGMMSAADKKKLDNLYPVGCIYQSTSSTSPASLFGGKWEQIASERVLMGASSAHAAGTTVNAGLPNITGDSWIRPNENTMTANGCFYMIGAKNRNPSVAGYNSNVSNAPTVGLDASRSSSIYGASSTVQPAAYYVYIWRRVS